MPIYMDRHDVSKNVTAENVAQIHQEDLKVQHKFGCRGLTYWFDDKRKTAFCLVEAPNKNALIKMHDLAHGEVPHQVIEVDARIVESFLGRIEDPKKARNTDLNIIDDPAFRTLMAVSLVRHSFKNNGFLSFNSSLQNIYRKIEVILKSFKGSIVQQNESGILISFQSVTKAVLCALKIQEDYTFLKNEHQLNSAELNIGLHAGVPVGEKQSIFEDTIKLARRMHFISRAEIVISAEVKGIYEGENLGAVLNKNQIYVLTRSEEKFINSLMEFIEKGWKSSSLKGEYFELNMGVSKSKLYREMIHLTGKSPAEFISQYRLQRSLLLLQKQKENISEVAFDSGFSSPSYFAKCFRKKYGITPSELSINFHS